MSNSDEILKIAVMWHGVSMLPKLRGMLLTPIHELDYAHLLNSEWTLLSKIQKLGASTSISQIMKHDNRATGPIPANRLMLLIQEMDASNMTEKTLHLPPEVCTPIIAFRGWDINKKLSGAQAIALQVFSLWVAVGENPDMCGSLYATWPIREATFLATDTSYDFPDLDIKHVFNYVEDDSLDLSELME